MGSAEPVSRPRGRPRKPEVDDEILAAAVELVCEGGFDHLTMEAVAAKAGVAKATVYRRFPGKVDLIVAACHVFSPEAPPTPDHGNVRDDLIELMMWLVDRQQRSDTGRLLPAMLCSSGVNDDVKEGLRQFIESRKVGTRLLLDRAIARGELRTDVNPEVAGELLVGAVTHRQLFAGDRLDRAGVEVLVDVVLHGIAAT